MATKAERSKIRNEKPNSWIAVEEEDKIIGKVVDVTDAWSDQRNNGSFYPLLTIEVEEATGYDNPGELLVHAFGTVLFNEVMRLKPEVGERVMITYKGTGEKKKQGRNAPELYKLRVAGRKGGAQSVYGRIQGTPAQPDQASQPPIEAEDFEQGTLDTDDDIPF